MNGLRNPNTPGWRRQVVFRILLAMLVGMVSPMNVTSGPQPETDCHWAFQPLRPIAPPAASGKFVDSNSIDRFLLAALESKGLRLAPSASREQIIRRVTYDLVGL